MIYYNFIKPYHKEKIYYVNISSGFTALSKRINVYVISRIVS